MRGFHVLRIDAHPKFFTRPNIIFFISTAVS